MFAEASVFVWIWVQHWLERMVEIEAGSLRYEEILFQRSLEIHRASEQLPYRWESSMRDVFGSLLKSCWCMLLNLGLRHRYNSFSQLQ